MLSITQQLCPMVWKPAIGPGRWMTYRSSGSTPHRTVSFLWDLWYQFLMLMWTLKWSFWALRICKIQKKIIRVAAGQCPQQSWPKEATGNSSLTKSFLGICVAPRPDELLWTTAGGWQHRWDRPCAKRWRGRDVWSEINGFVQTWGTCWVRVFKRILWRYQQLCHELWDWYTLIFRPPRKFENDAVVTQEAVPRIVIGSAQLFLQTIMAVFQKNGVVKTHGSFNTEHDNALELRLLFFRQNHQKVIESSNWDHVCELPRGFHEIWNPKFNGLSSLFKMVKVP